MRRRNPYRSGELIYQSDLNRHNDRSVRFLYLTSCRAPEQSYFGFLHEPIRLLSRVLPQQGRSHAPPRRPDFPISSIIDRIIPDKEARDRAKLELLRLQGTQELEQIRTQMSAILAEVGSTDPWTSRARPGFLYVMYIMILWSLPMA
jgi:hypothetical protein